MTTMRKCPKCGGELADDAAAGLCPKCLIQQGMATEIASTTLVAATTAGEPSPAEIAKRFPQLEILELLGKGGMGMVYKARQPQLDRLVALKIMLPDVARDPAFAERFTREARAMARLNHPNIVTVHDFGQVDGLFYILMEYVEGTNLRQMLKAGRLTPEQALGIVPRVCDALQYAHDEGITHRDIKPENILIDKKGRVKIADFGLAKMKGHVGTDISLTMTGAVMGTPRYMAPEQFENTKTVDHRADIYSLGVVFYEMLTGELPLGRFALPSQKVQVDVRLDEIVLRTLEQEPEQRYQHVSEVKTDVEGLTPRGGRASVLVTPAPGSMPPTAASVPSTLEFVRTSLLDFRGAWRLFTTGRGRYIGFPALGLLALAFALWVIVLGIGGVVVAPLILLSAWMGVAAIMAIFYEWWKSPSSFWWKILRTLLLLAVPGCFGSFIGMHADLQGFKLIKLAIGSPSPWLEFAPTSGWQTIGSWAWVYFAAGWLSLYAWRESFKLSAPANAGKSRSNQEGSF